MYTDKPYNQREGITLGTLQDVCQDCVKEGHYNPGELEYKEIFKLNYNGIPVCLCMKHFQQKLGKYVLLDASELQTDEPVTDEPKLEEEPPTTAKKTSTKKSTAKKADKK